MKAWLKRNYYRLRYYKKKIKIGENVLLNTKNYFEGRNTVGKHCEIATCNIGLGSYVADNSVIKNAIIGRFCSIGSNVRTSLGLHPSNIFVSTHPSFFSTKKQAGFSFVDQDIFKEHTYIDAHEQYVVEIGNDVWIGNNVIILDGIKIGNGAIIAAGSIVNKDVLPYAIAAGAPARLIQFRFSDDQIKKMLSIKWWDWPFEKIQSKSGYFCDIEAFISSLEK
jgi:acetyltransferase-like isoleucine patch superfamily enzyme